MNEKKVILVLGKRGGGKSYLAKSLLKNYDRYIIFDTLGEYTDGVCFDNLKDLGEFWDKYFDTKFRLIYQPLNPYKIIDKENEKTEFDIVCDLVWDCGNMALIVEEIDTFCSSMAITDSFANVIQRGRHRDITLIGISQRPYGINRLISSQSKEIYSFVMTEPRDIDYLSQYIGKDVEQIRELGQYQYLKWEASGKLAISKASGVVEPKELEKPKKRDHIPPGDLPEPPKENDTPTSIQK